MAKEQREMVAVHMFYDGTYEIEPAPSFMGTQFLSFKRSDKDGIVKDGIMVYCKKGMENYYLRRLAIKVEEHLDNKIKELQKQKKLFDERIKRLKKGE